MTNIENIWDELFPEVSKYSIGFRPTFDLLSYGKAINHNVSYPPYNLEDLGDDKYRLSMAIAGFTSNELKVVLNNGQLTIEGVQEKDPNKKYLYKGIAERNFTRSFCLNDYMVITGCNLDNGILTIDFKRELPESLKPKVIEIKTKDSVVNNMITDELSKRKSK